jgi:hypothetical protein
MGNRVIEDDIILNQPQSLTEPQASIADKSNGPTGFIVHFKASPLHSFDNVDRYARALLALSIDLHLMDDDTREGRVGIEAELFADVVDER